MAHRETTRPVSHAAPGQPIVVLERVSREFGDGPTRVAAVRNVSLEVRAGDTVALMGPSGSGKTTLLTLLGALDRPTSGRVVVDGIDVSGVPEGKLYEVRRQKVGFVFQDFYLVPNLTATENVLLPTLPLGRDHRLHRRAEELLVTVGLGERVGHRPNQLSGGEMQRVGIARALILDPPIVLADEPTGNLDSVNGAEVVNVLLRLNEERGTTIVVATHDERIADRMRRRLHMRDGEITDG